MFGNKYLMQTGIRVRYARLSGCTYHAYSSAVSLQTVYRTSHLYFCFLLETFKDKNIVQAKLCSNSSSLVPAGIFIPYTK